MEFALFSFIFISAITNAEAEPKAMALKNSANQNLTDEQRLQRLAQLCEELQNAVDQAGDHRRLLEQVKQTAQELLTDQESAPVRKKSRRRD
jgi:hypothetical protein